VLDGTDAVMLSAETASGKYPVETIEAMARVCAEADRSKNTHLDSEFLNRTFTRIDQSIAMSALFAASHLKVKAIAALTQSGSTALWASRLDSGVPVYALTPEERSRRRMCLYRAVHPLLMRYEAVDRELLLREAEDLLLREGVVEKGDLLVITIGEPIGKSGGTNTMKIVQVGEH
jgi:pyruvate kinase